MRDAICGLQEFLIKVGRLTLKNQNVSDTQRALGVECARLTMIRDQGMFLEELGFEQN